MTILFDKFSLLKTFFYFFTQEVTLLELANFVQISFKLS